MARKVFLRFFIKTHRRKIERLIRKLLHDRSRSWEQPIGNRLVADLEQHLARRIARYDPAENPSSGIFEPLEAFTNWLWWMIYQEATFLVREC
ncbi:MAG: hypothetical protein LAO77_19750 [Acidobacteriia bacterium]|nr:hypothetical protein [Terriglobia bacterium]